MARAMASASAVVSAAVRQVPKTGPTQLLRSLSFAIIGKSSEKADNALQQESAEQMKKENELICKFPMKEDIVADISLNLLMIDGYYKPKKFAFSARGAINFVVQILEQKKGGVYKGCDTICYSRRQRRFCNRNAIRRSTIISN